MRYVGCYECQCVRLSTVYLENIGCAKTAGQSEDGKRCAEIMIEAPSVNQSASYDEWLEDGCRCELASCEAITIMI